MGKKEDLISKLSEIEWDLFSSVQNRGGKASCQENPETFKIIRTSSFMGWSDETLESYLNDLEESKKDNRNLMTEKYAIMEGLMKLIDPEKLSLIDNIVEIECGWAAEIAEKSPNLGLARPIYSSQDTRGVVSSETYGRGELATYSKKTLELYYKNILELKSKNINGIELNCERMLKKFKEISQ